MKNMKKIIILTAFLVTINFLPTVAQVIDAPPYDGVWVKEHVVNLEPIPWTYLREADVFWGTRIWRNIDMREKINQPLYYPEKPIAGRKNLMAVIFEGLKENMLTAYGDDEFLNPQTYDEIMARLEREDTIQAVRPYPPYDTYDTVIKREFDQSAVMMFRVKEDWFFDKQRSVMEARILGIAPYVSDYDEQGEFRGFRLLFWVYFPEARKLLAENEVFRRHNDAERLSYDDIFFKRMFSSYILKESNVYNRFISDYALGMDALLESERIKEEIFFLEHDLWEY